MHFSATNSLYNNFPLHHHQRKIQSRFVKLKKELTNDDGYNRNLENSNDFINKNTHNATIFQLSISSNKIDPKQTINTNLKKENLVKMHEISFFTKIFVVFRNFSLFHLIATILNLLIMIIQNFYQKSCFLSPICICDDSIFTKIYSILKDILVFWAFIIYMLSKLVFQLKIMIKRKYIKIIFFIIAYIGVFYIFLMADKNSQNIELARNVLYFEILLYTIYYLLYLFLIKFNIKLWIRNFMKGGFLAYIFLLNAIIVELVFIQIRGTDQIMLIKIMKMAYINILIISIKKFPWLYYQTLLNEINEKREINNRIINLSRFCCCYVISFSVLTLSRLKLNEYGFLF